MKRPLQLVTIPVQETEIWKDDTYRHRYDLTFVAMPGVSVEEILSATKDSPEFQDRTYELPEDTGDRLFGNYMIGRSFKFFRPKVSTFKDRLEDWDMAGLRKRRFIWR